MTTDRDRSIERLLRQARSGDPATPAGDCPDAETLAALADDTLTAAARREVEAHVADCLHCLELTAAMVRAAVPASTPVDASGDVPAWRRRAFNWLVPAAAAATAVALWVLVPGQQTPVPTEPTSERQVAAAPPPALPPPTSEVITSEPLRLPDEARADNAARERDASTEVGRAVPATPPAEPAPELSLDALKSETSPTANVQDSAARRSEVAPDASAPVAQERALSRQAAPPLAVGTAAGAAGARAAGGVEILSPNPRIRWRIGPGPVVQYSVDGGATWTTQQTGASAALTAGSAPAAEVCWLVGRGGLVLRTTDGGRQWQRVTFPEPVDLVAITASSARNVTVVLTDGRRFATNDGGVTWTPVR